MLLLMILAAWALGLLIVVGLCTGARLGDAAQEQALEPLAAPLTLEGRGSAQVRVAGAPLRSAADARTTIAA